MAANRRNGALSHGPKTEKGKARSRWNALKHGLLARSAVIAEGEAKEDPKEIQSLLREFRRDLKPVGTLEEMCVEEIAVCYWRLRRGHRAELAEIRKAVDGMERQAAIAGARAFAAEKAKLVAKEFQSWSFSREVLSYKQELIVAGLGELECEEFLDANWISRAGKMFHSDADGFYQRCYAANVAKSYSSLRSLLEAKELKISEELLELQKFEEAEMGKRTLDSLPIHVALDVSRTTSVHDCSRIDIASLCSLNSRQRRQEAAILERPLSCDDLFISEASFRILRKLCCCCRPGCRGHSAIRTLAA